MKLERGKNARDLKLEAFQKVLGSPAQRRHRRYNPNDNILIEAVGSTNKHLVNQLGFSKDHDEHKGPYIYTLATVVRVHFDENIAYYTVRREDTNEELRADALNMYPIMSGAGLDSAKRAAYACKTNSSPSGGKSGKKITFSSLFQLNNKTTKRSNDNNATSSTTSKIDKKTKIFTSLSSNSYYENLYDSSCLNATKYIIYNTYRTIILHASLFLKGQKPFFCSLKLSYINIIVLCSIWYSFMDMLLLAIIPDSTYDHAFNIVSTVVWFILSIELIVEVFIRPEGYKIMLYSENAYSPITARFINTFHLLFEVLSLLLYLPLVISTFNPSLIQESAIPFYIPYFTLMAILGPYEKNVIFGRIYFGLVKLRLFSLLRHWKKWIHMNMIIKPEINDEKMRYHYKLLDFSNGYVKKGQLHYRSNSDEKLLNDCLLDHTNHDSFKTTIAIDIKKDNDRKNSDMKKKRLNDDSEEATFREKQLVNATSIGTALMTINSHRLMLFGVLMAGIIPILLHGEPQGNYNMVQFLQDNNVAITSNTSSDCKFLERTIYWWLFDLNSHPDSKNEVGEPIPKIFVLWLQVSPIRCPIQSPSGVITADICDKHYSKNRSYTNTLCPVWFNTTDTTPNSELASRAKIRVSSVQTYSTSKVEIDNEVFYVNAKFNESITMKGMCFNSFLLQVSLFFVMLLALELLRLDAGKFVLNPFRSMLKIVSLYAKKPLAPPPKKDDKTNNGDDELQLGKYETEQLINAITKITDLLRKCWGVAGANIITANLARQADGTTTELNPCVPGTRVYALFSFAALCNFEYVLKNLGADILILINDVANVLHEEVYRWGFGESGQCNKNLGAAFLFVFRIGAAKDVQEKKERATEVIFSTSGYDKKRFGVNRHKVSKRLEKQTIDAKSAVQLHSLPGIQEFADRAVIGLLKSFAGLYRNTNLKVWGEDFRLNLGHGRFSVDMVFGMHAGWAVEGAVGSEYKIDATYLSPHVNMAARMMTACKQYGVSILLTEAIEKLMSEPAREKLRHIDTVTVKGSSIPQRIYTYDMRHEGVNFFLFAKEESQADIESDRYTPLIWLSDQDLNEMRQHVTDEFTESFQKGIQNYLSADWATAYKHLKKANEIMVQNVLEQGYITEDNSAFAAGSTNTELNSSSVKAIQSKQGDGPSKNIMSYIKKHNYKAPRNWKGYRALTSK